jgi:hypothetical protein
VKIQRKIRLIKITALTILIGGVFLMFRLFLPIFSHNRRLFDLGPDYKDFQKGSVQVYYNPKHLPLADLQILAKEFDSFVTKLEKSAWGQKLGIKRPLGEGISIIIHSNNNHYKAFWREDSRVDMESSGKYRAADRTIGIRLMSETQLMKKTFRHETIHLLLDLSGISGQRESQLPIWINEGLAQYFESGFKGGTKLTYDYTDKLMVPLASLVELNPKDYYAKDKAYHHYRESLLLVAFLMEGKEQLYRDRFLDWVRRKGRRWTSLKALVTNVFDLRRTEFLEQFHNFLDDRHPARSQKHSEKNQ